MKFAIIENGAVTNIAESESAIESNWVQCSDAVSIGQLYDGVGFSDAPPSQLTPEQLQDEVVTKTQERLDNFARTRNYDGILSACTYATSTVPKFQQEGQYCVEARDATWATLYQYMSEVEAGTKPMPSGYADVEPSLPVLVWPV